MLNIIGELAIVNKLNLRKRTMSSKDPLFREETVSNYEVLQTVFDTTNLAIAVLKTLYDETGEIKDFLYLRINKVLRELYQDKNPLGHTVLEISTYSVQMGIFEALKEVAKSGQPLDRDFHYNQEGQDTWFRLTVRPQKDLLVATLEDITQPKAEAEELKETVRFKRQLVRTSPETILIINLNTHKVRYINKDIFPEVGMTREKIQGMPLADILPFIHPRDREKVTALHKKLLKSSDDDIIDIEVRLKLKGDTWEWFSVRGKIFHRKSADWVDEYVLLVRNITEQKNTQKALLKAEKFSIQGEIARTLAHELRNPLASIGMAAELLEKKVDPSQREELKNYIDILSRSTATLNNLVSNLLNTSNYSPAVLRKEDLAEILKSTIEKAADRIYLAGIKVISKFDGPYPILADKEKLIIALLNIIVNASEATTPDHGIIEIAVTKNKTDFILSIRDNGHGLEQDQIDKLFEAFYTNKSTGVGVGLSSVKTILEDHDAPVKVTSKPNVGTCFDISFHNASLE